MTYTSKELQSKAQITSRQMNHWFRRGWLISFDRPEGTGSGVPIEWPLRTIRKAVLMSELVKAGFRPDHAHRIAERNLNRPNGTVSDYPWTVHIGPHLVLTIQGEGVE